MMMMMIVMVTFAPKTVLTKICLFSISIMSISKLSCFSEISLIKVMEDKPCQAPQWRSQGPGTLLHCAVHRPIQVPQHSGGESIQALVKNAKNAKHVSAAKFVENEGDKNSGVST